MAQEIHSDLGTINISEQVIATRVRSSCDGMLRLGRDGAP